MGDREDLSFEQQLHNYQKRVSNILESFTDGFFEVDKNWKVTYWNKEAENMLRMPRRHIVGKNLWEVYKDAIPLKFFTEYHKAMAGNVSVRFEEFFPRKNMWLEVAAFPSGEGLSIYFKDITEGKNAIVTLQNERQKYVELFNLSPVPQWVYDVDTLQFLDVNQAAIEHYGYSRMEFMKMTIADIRPEEDQEILSDILSNRITTGIFNKSIVRHVKKNGQHIHVYVAGNTVWFEDKNARLVMVIDRTEEMQAKKAMEESIERFNIVSKATSDAIWDWNIETDEITWNRGITGIFGYREKYYDSKWWRHHIHPDDLKVMLRKINGIIRNRKHRLQNEYRFRAADGTYKFVQDRAFLLFNKDGVPVRMIGSMQDITSQVQHTHAIEAHNTRLQEISWLQSHKVRSPLAKILGLVSLLEDDELDMETLKEFLPYLKRSAEELDEVHKEIVKKTS